ncbi:MAG: amidohydrolase family protein [Wenzhouxiangellaceae bacterium]|nr:amidohydrolase family protein [Wenzhouxiangellaceae bacterium]
MRALSLIGLITLALAAGSAFSETLHVRAGHVLNIDTGERLAERVIVIRDGRIVQIASAEEIKADRTAQTIDLSGYTVLPGLSDAHVHFTSDHDKHGYRRLADSLPRMTLTGARNARNTLMAGFTTVRNVGAPSFSDVALRDAIAAGDIPGPRMLVSGPPIGITGGHCSDNNLLPPEFKATGDGVADGPWAVRQAVRRNVKYGADMIKTCSTGGVLSRGTQVGAPQYTLEELTALVDEAHMHGRKVASHAHGTEGIRTAIEAGVDSIEHASLIDAEGIRLAVERGTALSMDIYVTEYILGAGEDAGILPESLEKERQVGTTQRENFAAALRAGAIIAFGTDAGVYPHGDNARQLSRMTRFGMTPLQALQAATLTNARLFGLQDEIGRIEPGYRADLIAVEGDPLKQIETLERVVFVMKDGQVYKSP